MVNLSKLTEESMRQASYLLWVPSLLSIGCTTTAPPPQHARASGGTAVSVQKHYELSSVADELNYEDPCTLARPARGTAYDECLLSLDCTYCRNRDGWWMLQACDAQVAPTAARDQACAAWERCGAS